MGKTERWMIVITIISVVSFIGIILLESYHLKQHESLTPKFDDLILMENNDDATYPITMEIDDRIRKYEFFISMPESGFVRCEQVSIQVSGPYFYNEFDCDGQSSLFSEVPNEWQYFGYLDIKMSGNYTVTGSNFDRSDDAKYALLIDANNSPFSSENERAQTHLEKANQLGNWGPMIGTFSGMMIPMTFLTYRADLVRKFEKSARRQINQSYSDGLIGIFVALLEVIFKPKIRGFATISGIGSGLIMLPLWFDGNFGVPAAAELCSNLLIAAFAVEECQAIRTWNALGYALMVASLFLYAVHFGRFRVENEVHRNTPETNVAVGVASSHLGESQAMFCGSCGSRRAASTAFCTKCGAAMGQSSEESIEHIPNPLPPNSMEAQQKDEHGFEWLRIGGENFFRVADSGAEWKRYDS